MITRTKPPPARSAIVERYAVAILVDAVECLDEADLDRLPDPLPNREVYRAAIRLALTMAAAIRANPGAVLALVPASGGSGAEL